MLIERTAVLQAIRQQFGPDKTGYQTAGYEY